MQNVLRSSFWPRILALKTAENQGFSLHLVASPLSRLHQSWAPLSPTPISAQSDASPKSLCPNNGKVVNTYDTLARLTATRLRSQGNTDLNKHEYVYSNRDDENWLEASQLCRIEAVHRDKVRGPQVHVWRGSKLAPRAKVTSEAAREMR
jgi:hypothetical protein